MADNNFQQNEQNQYYQNPDLNTQPKEEKASVGLAILSFIIPLAGLIIFLTKKDTKPKTAKVSGICALVSFLISIVSSIIMTVAGGALFGTTVNDIIEGGTVNAEAEIVSDNTLGDYGCVVKGAQLTKDWEGKDAVMITYEFTNNASEPISFDIALDAAAFQNGIGLETAVLDDETDIIDAEIKSGVTKEVKKAYVLNDTTTPVEIEITEWLSFTNEKIVTTVELG